MVHRRQSVAVARRDDEQGAVIILLALFIVTLLVMVALVIDIGNAGQTRRQAQNAADAAALAAAVVVAQQPDAPDLVRAVDDAKRYVFSNYGDVDWNSCTDSDALNYKPKGPDNECISFDNNTTPNMVRVRVPTRSVETFFGSIAGLNDIKVTASAEAQIPEPLSAPCGLCVLSPSAPEALHLQGDRALTVNGNGVVVNSNHSDAVVTDDNSYLYAAPVKVVGGFAGEDIRPNGAQNLPTPVPDPLSGIGAPPLGNTSGDRDFTDNANATLSPGNYHTIRLIGDTILHLGAGLYVITGEINVGSSAHLEGTGAMIYFTCGGTGDPTPCSRGGDGGTLKTQGDGTISLSAPTSGTYKGMALFYDRNNTIRLTVTPKFQVTGTIYLASGALEFAEGQDTSLNSMVVADTVKTTTGPGNVTLSFNESQNADVRQIPRLFGREP